MDRAPAPITRLLDAAIIAFVALFFAFYPVSGAFRGGPLPKAMVGLCLAAAVWDVVTRWARIRVGVIEALLLAFGLWYVVAIAAASYPPLARPTMITVVGWTVVALAMAQLLCSSTRLYAALVGYVVGAAAAATWALVNVATGLTATAQIEGEDVNDTGFWTSTGAILAIGLLVSRSTPRWIRLLCAPAAIVTATAVAGSLSRGSALGLGLGLVVLFVRSREARGPLVKAAVVAVVAAFALSPLWLPTFQSGVKLKSNVAEKNVDSRLDAWVVGANLGAENPLTGTGPQTIAPYILEQDHIPPGGFVVHVAHNTVVEAFYGTGLVGLLLLGASVAGAFTATNRTASRARGAVVHHGRGGAAVLAMLVTALACSMLTTQLANATMWLVLILGAAGTSVPLPRLLPARLSGLSGIARRRPARRSGTVAEATVTR